MQGMDLRGGWAYSARVPTAPFPALGERIHSRRAECGTLGFRRGDVGLGSEFTRHDCRSSGVPPPTGGAVAQEVFDVLAVLDPVGMALAGESLGDF